MSDEYVPQHSTETNSSSGLLFSNGVYDFVKFLAMIAFPAVGTLYFALASIWGLPAANEVVGTIVALDAFLGVVIGISKNAYDSSDDKYDGTLDVVDNGDGTGMINLEPTTHPAEFAQRKQVTFKVNPNP